MSKAAELANLIGNINAGGGGVNRNVIINGAMNVAQRATSEADVGGAGKYSTVDRFKILPSVTSGRVTMSQDSSAPSGFANSLKLDVTTADTSVAAGEYFIITQKIEGQNLQGFAKGTSDAKPFAVSFYVKGNASATYACELFDSNSRQASKLFNVTTDWTRVELTFDPDTTGTFADDNAMGLELNFWLHAGSNFSSGTLNQTFASNDNTKRAAGISSLFDSTDRTFFITGVQLEVGQNPTSFEHEPFERTLAKCQRYFVSYGGDSAYERSSVGFNFSSTQARMATFLPVQLRSTPSVAKSGDMFVGIGGGEQVVTGVSNDNSSTKVGHVQFSVSSGLTTGQGSNVLWNNNTTARLTFDSEL
tara:strand:+ start:872 stop:1957 length:1086 start_codon:yes stop_codon:yes gene_type:complete